MVWRLLGLILMVMALPVRAATIHVPSDQPTIQAAMELAAAGDTVLVAPGTYFDCTQTDPYGDNCCAILPSGVALLGATGNPADVIIAPPAGARGIFVPELSEATRIEGISVVGGTGGSTGGGGIYYAGGEPLRIVRCDLVANVSTGSGSGIYVNGGSLDLEDCRLEGNLAASNYGGAIYAFSANLTARCCRFLSNEAIAGGAVEGYGGGSMRFEDCSFVGNTATNRAGAVGCRDFANLDVLGCSFRANQATDPGSGLAGAIDCLSTAATLWGCTLLENAASVGGGIALRGDGAVGSIEQTIIAFSSAGESVHCESGGTASVGCSDFYGNAGGDWTGCLTGLDAADGNLAADPEICSGFDAGMMPLAPTSPCLPPNNSCGLQIGAWGVDSDCDGNAATAATSWSKIKSHY